MKKYQVIGGQYEQYWYGETDSLHAAKLMSTANEEYWDNWQGWHKPGIYLADDVAEIVSQGNVIARDGSIIRVHRPGAMPICYWDSDSKKWISMEA